ncbi:unnamed protein product [Oncorhynchus mykiss]|uniref:Uncharacterized protein n=1 Tax=Oncorhynchus mykiss TaxID=8022 RepID=A0A060Y1Z1_ONCMY|nr:unnamed protein product [Oncorhynchus mykiss]
MLQADDDDDIMEMQTKTPFGSSFRTFNATDYKPIATIDVKRNIFDLCTDTKDCYLAVIENQDSVNTDTVCRLYEVGRQRLAEEEEDEDDQEDDDQDDDDDDDDDSDDDMDTDPLIAELDNENGEDEEDEEDGNNELSLSDDEVSRLLEGDGEEEEEDDDDDDDDDDSDDDEEDGDLALDNNSSDNSDLEDDIILSLNE